MFNDQLIIINQQHTVSFYSSPNDEISSVHYFKVHLCRRDNFK